MRRIIATGAALIISISLAIFVGFWVLVGTGASYLWENRTEITEQAGKEGKNLRDAWQRGASDE